MHGSTLRWTRLRHDTFGGVTHYQALLGTLRRTIRHIVDYSLKPKWAQPPALGDPPPTMLTLDDRIHPDDLERRSIYHTHYSATGWGSRGLSRTLSRRVRNRLRLAILGKAGHFYLGPFFPVRSRSDHGWLLEGYAQVGPTGPRKSHSFTFALLASIDPKVLGPFMSGCLACW
jgi:hypothetical protein